MQSPDISHPDFASYYDELPLWSAPFALRLLEQAPLKRGASIMDVGCGTGFLTVELAQRCGPEATIYAVDPWLSAMDRLDRKLDYYGIKNVELIRRGCEATGLPDRSIDLIVSNLGINNFSDPAVALQECLRVLKPGGRLILTTNLQGHMAEVYLSLREVLQDLGLLHHLKTLGEQEAHRGTIATTSALLASIGFANITHKPFQFPMRFADGATMLSHWFMRLAFIPGWAAATGNDPRVLPALEAALNAKAMVDGDLRLTIPGAVFESAKQ